MATDMQDVAEALIGDHAGSRTLVLEHGVGRRRRRVKNEVDRLGLDLIGGKQFQNAGHDALRRVFGRGRDLVDRDRAGSEIAINEVGESAADIDAYGLHKQQLLEWTRRLRDRLCLCERIKTLDQLAFLDSGEGDRRLRPSGAERERKFAPAQDSLGSEDQHSAIKTPSPISCAPRGKLRERLSISKPASPARNASVTTVMNTTPTTAPERLPMPPTISIAIVMKVRSR